MVTVAACGGGGGDGQPPGSARVETNDSDQALAESIVLRLDDFPSGWRATQSDDDEDENLGDCYRARLDLADVAITGRAESDSFSVGANETEAASSVALVLADEQQASAAYVSVGDVLNDCLAELLEESLQDSEVTVSAIDIGELSFPSFGDDSSAFQVKVTVEDPETEFTVDAFVDVIQIRAGRASSTVFFVDVFSPFDQALKEELVGAVSARMKPAAPPMAAGKGDSITPTGSDDEDAEQAVAQPPPAPPSEPPPASEGLGTRGNPVPAGTAAALSGGWELTVLSVTPDATAQVLVENEFNDPPASGFQFFIATVQATYTGTGSDTLSSYRLRALGPSAVSYSTFEDSCGSITNEIPGAEVFSGGTISGNVCWSVKSSDAGALVMFDDSLFGEGSDRVWFTLSG